RFIVDTGTDLPDERVDRRRYHDRGFDENDEDVDDLERRIQERFSRPQEDYDEEATDVEQQALLPSVRDPKLWMVKCAIGREREVAVCLMQKYIDRGSDLQIRSVVALDHLKNYIYVEADKEAHVKEAIKGMRNIYANQKILLVPIREMTDVLSVESKAIDLSRDTWVRMKIGTYKGDLAKVVDVDNVRQRVTVKLIPRIDLQALASKLDGREVAKKKAFVPPPRFMNIDEARELHIRVERRRDPMTGDYFENIGGMLFKDGFMYKTVSLKSIIAQNVTPTFDELEKFNKPSENGESGDFGGLSTLFANRKKGHFMKGDAVIVIKGDLKNLKGWVEKVDEDNVLIRSGLKGLPDPLAVNEKELCKYFEPGNHVKVVSGTHEGATGMVVKVDQHVLILLSDTTKEHVRVFADHVVESSEVTTGVTKIGQYELHDLVLLEYRCIPIQCLQNDVGILSDVTVPKPFEKSELLSFSKRSDRFTWTIRGFSTLTQYTYSDVISFAGRKWQLGINPSGSGSGSGKAVSLFFHLLANQRTGAYEAVYVLAKFQVLNQLKLGNIQMELENWYGITSFGWGFSEFVSFDDLRDSSKGFLVDDALMVQVELEAISTTKYFPS
ncbi:hypothetical protein DY000_02002920, partial [Brassica cretica]